jgi:hypothetical protein
MMLNKDPRPTAEKIRIFRSLFSGLDEVYGTYDLHSGRSMQVKAAVTEEVILAHLSGRRPYGVYLLMNDRTRAIAADFDTKDPFPAKEFVSRATGYEIPAYIECSKSKGYHAWIFFQEEGVQALKARKVVSHILGEVDHPQTEIFPKQDRLDNTVQYGNFINAPLFGTLVPLGKTVFVHPETLEPYADQWSLLESVHRVSETVLDTIIETNRLDTVTIEQAPLPSPSSENKGTFGLPPCARKILRDGVTRYQRVSCFRLAIHLKRIGLPYDTAIAVLKTWALKNRPQDGKSIIEETEIISQTSCAYECSYSGCGCSSLAIQPFCDPRCPVKQWEKERNASPQEKRRRAS